MATGLTSMATAASGVGQQLQQYFSRKLLEYAVPMLKFADYAMKTPLPSGQGSDGTVKWFRYKSPATGDIQTPTEGTPAASSTWKKLQMDAVSATLDQYSQTIAITDLLTAQQLFNNLEQASRTQGEDAALHADTLIRNTLCTATGSNTLRYGAGATAMASAGLSLVAGDILDAATNLKINNTPTINGYYVGILPAQSCNALMAVTGGGEWLDINKYTTNTPLLNGEVGKAYGVRIVEHTNPFTSASGALHTYDATGSIHHAIITGRDAYGTVDLTSQSPYSPQMYIVSGADHADPAAQQTLVTWKSYWAQAVLNSSFFVQLLHRVSYA